jgi:nitric oxide reductase large subunit
MKTTDIENAEAIYLKFDLAGIALTLWAIITLFTNWFDHRFFILDAEIDFDVIFRMMAVIVLLMMSMLYWIRVKRFHQTDQEKPKPEVKENGS